MKIVLKPYWIAEECFLSEALMWAAFYRYPTSEIIPDHIDVRFDNDSQEEYDPTIPQDHGYIESEESIRAGLGPSPEWERLFDDDGVNFFVGGFDNGRWLESSMYANIPGKKLTKKEREEEAKKLFSIVKPDLDYEATKAKAIKSIAAEKEWDEKYAHYIELIESKIFVFLREGKLEAQGRKIPKIQEDRFSWTDYEHEPIPANYWKQKGIDWPNSASKNRQGHYCHIYVRTEQLMQLFPAPEAKQAHSVQLIADQYILEESDSEKPILPKGNRGRPSKNWESFYLEVMDRVKNDNLPTKQEAFISEMQDWCVKNWGVDVGRSTILQKISPIYKRFKRK